VSSPTGRLTGAVAVVTGASSGIGRATAVAIAEAGARTVLVARRQAELERTAKLASTARVEPVDITNDRAVLELARRLSSDPGRVDVLVHAAGRIALGPLAEAPVTDLDGQFAVNVRAPYLLTQALLPALVAARGTVVFVNSTAGRAAGPGASQYAATKYALRGLADALRAEVNASGVRVLTLFPGRTATPMQRSIHEHEDRAYRPERLLQPTDVANALVAALALPDTAEITEMAIRPRFPPA
jgi:NADP-dependent 3-hydroxy acid dehydrogenase YdfG